MLGLEPGIAVIRLWCGQGYESFVSDPQIAVIYQGQVGLYLGRGTERECGSGEIKFLAPGNRLYIESREESTIILMKVDFNKPCFTLRLDELRRYRKHITHDFGSLPSHPTVEAYLKNLMSVLDTGMRCVGFMDIKIQEFIHILMAFYSRRELTAFFYPLLAGKDISFTNFIYANISVFPDLDRLSSLANMSKSGFSGRFRKEFGISPRSFYVQYLIEAIKEDLAHTRIPVKTLAAKYGFGSHSSFSKFCKKNLGCPPGEMRKRLILNK